MRFMVIVKASPESERDTAPTTQELSEMGAYNEQLVQAGVMLAAEGLHSSTTGKRVRFEGDRKLVTDGPFAEAKELVAGFWLWRCRDIDEALDWLKRAPFREGEVEIRQVAEAEDFESMTPELRAQEERLQAAAKRLRQQ